MKSITLSRWLLLSEWKTHLTQAAVTISAIALGIALGFAVHLINTAAFNEFSAVAKSLSGESDLQVRGTQANFSELLYPTLVQRNGVELASPVLELNVVVPGTTGKRKNVTLKILGLDIFRAANIAPGLIGMPAEDRQFDTLADDAIFLSPAAMEWLKVKRGDPMKLRVGTQTIMLRVAGTNPCRPTYWSNGYRCGSVALPAYR
jgi:putative ABC transport system permease protein